jgi:hypothetical protein
VDISKLKPWATVYAFTSRCQGCDESVDFSRAIAYFTAWEEHPHGTTFVAHEQVIFLCPHCQLEAEMAVGLVATPMEE